MTFAELQQRLIYEIREDTYNRYSLAERQAALNEAYQILNLDAYITKKTLLVSVPPTNNGVYFTYTLPSDCIQVLNVVALDTLSDGSTEEVLTYRRKDKAEWNEVCLPGIYYYDIVLENNAYTLYAQVPGSYQQIAIKYLAKVNDMVNDTDVPFNGLLAPFHYLIAVYAAYLLLRYDDPQMASIKLKEYQDGLMRLWSYQYGKEEYTLQWQ
jgi:hypothetical protein